MKITDADIIQTGERELIDAITADLDWGVIEDIFKKDHHLGIEEEVEFRRGDMVVHDDQIAYKLDFEVKIPLSVLLDREGNYLSVTSSADLHKEDAEIEGAVEEIASEETVEESYTDESEKSEDGYQEAVAELDTSAILEDSESDSPVPPQDEKERISQAASNAGEIIEEMKTE